MPRSSRSPSRSKVWASPAEIRRPATASSRICWTGRPVGCRSIATLSYGIAAWPARRRDHRGLRVSLGSPRGRGSSGQGFVRPLLDQALCRDTEPLVQPPDHLEGERSFVTQNLVDPVGVPDHWL